MLKLFALIVALTSTTTLLAQSTSQSDPVLEDCQLLFLPENYIEISSNKAGILDQMGVREGTRVEKDDVIARLDDVEAKMQLHVNEQKRRAAAARYYDEVERKYAEAAAAVAEANYEDLREANSGGVEKVVTETDLRQAKLEWDRAKLQIEKALKDKQLAGYDYLVAKAEAEAAQLEIDRRVITAPFGGQVMELFRKQGEWVDPGEPILQFAKYDVLRCDGKINLQEYDPREIEGCEVTIEAVVALGRKVQARGRIIHVDQQVGYEGGGTYTYRVQAEIANRTEGGRWALFPGLEPVMTIHLGTADANISRSE